MSQQNETAIRPLLGQELKSNCRRRIFRGLKPQTFRKKMERFRITPLPGKNEGFQVIRPRWTDGASLGVVGSRRRCGGVNR
jgi:hypothetical protein